MTPTRTRAFATLVALAFLAVAGCTRPQESSGGSVPLDSRAPEVSVAENQAWTLASAGSGALKIVVLNMTAQGPTTMRWQDVVLHGPDGNLTPTSAYIRTTNGSFGWNASRTLALNESMTAEFHYRANSTMEEPTSGFLAGPGWRTNFTLTAPTPSRP